MMSINKDTVLSELLTFHSELIPVVNRFGIRLGVGDKSIGDVCKRQNLCCDFVITVLSAYLNDSFKTPLMIHEFDVMCVIDYLKKTVDNFLHAYIPNLEKHFAPFIAMSNNENGELELLHSIFYKFKVELTSVLQEGIEDFNASSCDLLYDLKNIIIKHISGNYNQNLAYAVIFSISSLEKELLMHNHFINTVLRPKIKEMDVESAYDLHLLFENHGGDTNHNSSALSNREIEVLKLIVQGRLNKEIADLLNISLNTVLTHRKNIISKTGIKTVSGLTFYSISNGYVASTDYKL